MPFRLVEDFIPQPLVMLKFLRSLLPSLLAGAVIGLIVLGIGGRLMMRIIVHWEGRVPVLTPLGTFTVVMMGALAGIAAGTIHGVLRRFIARASVRLATFLTICVGFTLQGVNELLPRPKLLFVALTVVYCVVLELARSRQRSENVESTL